MNKSKLKGIGSIVAKAAAIIGLAGGASLASDMFLFGGKFSNNDKDDDEQTEKATETSETTEETEKVPAEDVTVEDTKDKEKEETE